MAENKNNIGPNHNYLSKWQEFAPAEWVKLSHEVKNRFNKKQSELEEVVRQIELKRHTKEEKTKYIEREVSKKRKELNYMVSRRIDPASSQKINRRNKQGNIVIEDIIKIITPNKKTWIEEESELVQLKETPRKFPIFEVEEKFASVLDLNKEISIYNSLLENDKKTFEENKKFFTNVRNGYKKAEQETVVKRINYVVDRIILPHSIPKIWDADFDTERRIALVEVKLPDIVHNHVYKNVQLKSGVSKKPLNQKEEREEIPKIHPAIILRLAYEIFRNDNVDIIKLLVVNGWVEFNDPATGNTKKVYTASLVIEKNKIINLNLEKLEPLSAFANLSGKSAGRLIDVIPITPIMALDRKDKRFIETREVLNQLSSQANLASMDWQDFENLIAELFQKEFSEEGMEIKLTQSSRDKGVDAIVFNPDPIRGGKYVIQAKRYTNTVDVSAVRDLVAVVMHEGASRGILVTTSTFGADAYAFIQNKPITLLDGAKLLGLLEKHGYKFRINLEEAKKLNINDNN